MTSALTAEERKVVVAMATARTEADAAVMLGLSPQTVHAYLRSARAKQNVRTTRALVRKFENTHDQA